MNAKRFLLNRPLFLMLMGTVACGGELVSTGGGGGGAGGTSTSLQSSSSTSHASSSHTSTTVTASNASTTDASSSVTSTVSSVASSVSAVASSVSSSDSAASSSVSAVASSVEASVSAVASSVSASVSSSSSSSGSGGGGADITPPLVVFTLPIDQAVLVPLNSNVTATFDEPMAPATINGTNFVLTQGATQIPATVSYAGTVATLDPTSNLLPNTSYTATVTTGVTDLASNALASADSWTFQTGAAVAQGPAPVNLGTAANYVILAESGIAAIPPSVLTGNIGVSPIDATAITGFSLILDPSGTFSTSTQVTGRVYAANYASPTPGDLTTAIGNMQTAYTDAAGRLLPDFVALGAGEIGGLTLDPGLYQWSTGVSITTDVTLHGGPNDVWILQIAGGVTEMANIQVHLTGGASPKNVFWQTSGVVVLNPGAHIEGVVLAATQITLGTGASATGRLFSQTAVTLDAATVSQPLP